MYDHTQRAPMCLLIYAAAGLMAVPAWALGNMNAAAIPLFCGAALMGFLGAAFHYLRVTDEGDRLEIAFGPLPLFRREILYSDINSVEVGRTTLVEGWGIHLSPRGGWVWNLWGRDCVLLKLRTGSLRVGSDDVEHLARFLNDRLSQDRD